MSNHEKFKSGEYELQKLERDIPKIKMRKMNAI